MRYYMAKSFKQLKSPKLGMFDILQIGKYKGCRIDSIVDMDYEYLIYMEKEKILYFADGVIAKLKDKFSGYGDEVISYIPDSYDKIMGYVNDGETETVYYADGSGYVPGSGPCGPFYFDYNGNT